MSQIIEILFQTIESHCIVFILIFNFMTQKDKIIKINHQEQEVLLQKSTNHHINQKLEQNLSETQGKFLKNSIYRKLHSPKLPPKRRKKTPGLTSNIFSNRGHPNPPRPPTNQRARLRY